MRLHFFLVLTSLPLVANESEANRFLIDANRAQIVMLAETGLLPENQARRIATALLKAASDQEKPGAKVFDGYLQLETRLVELAGPEASNIHLGRSRNDLGETIDRMLLRELLLENLTQINTARVELHRHAAKHIETVMPGFTHAVQAQPTTVAHFLLAFDAALARDSERLRECYSRINLSPLGSGAFTTSGFALDRDLLARLLGFTGLVENAYDAIMVAPADSKMEFAGALGISAMSVGRFAQYLLFQYDAPAPGFALDPTLTSRSSAMPQKRNPSSVERLRLAASEVMANAHTSALLVHNTPLYEVKDAREDHLLRLQRYAAEAAQMHATLATVVKSIVIRPEVLREQVERDYSAMTELAETLHREAGTPFRTGHAVASELTTRGRAQGKRPSELSHGEVSAAHEKVTGKPLPLTEEQLRIAFDPLEIIRSRKGRGGPQPVETRRMLDAQQDATRQNQNWIKEERHRLQKASETLRAKFEEWSAVR